jgi:hypothetical protein
MRGMKITVDAAMRARDVSRPRPEQEELARENEEAAGVARASRLRQAPDHEAGAAGAGYPAPGHSAPGYSAAADEATRDDAARDDAPTDDAAAGPDRTSRPGPGRRRRRRR